MRTTLSAILSAALVALHVIGSVAAAEPTGTLTILKIEGKLLQDMENDFPATAAFLAVYADAKQAFQFPQGPDRPQIAFRYRPIAGTASDLFNHAEAAGGKVRSQPLPDQADVLVSAERVISDIGAAQLVVTAFRRDADADAKTSIIEGPVMVTLRDASSLDSVIGDTRLMEVISYSLRNDRPAD